MKGAVLITGGSRRIGKGLAMGLAQEGYAIALHYHTSDKDALASAAEISALGVRCEIFKCDLSRQSSVTSLIPAVLKKIPDVQVLINNASIFERASLTATSTEQFNRILDVNFKAPFLLCREFAKHCKRGSIINILDTKISKYQPVYFAYTLSKKALEQLTYMAAKELGPKIRVNGVAPGLVLPSADRNKRRLEQMAGKIPLKKSGKVQDVVDAVKYLLNAQYVTGQCLFADGGQNI